MIKNTLIILAVALVMIGGAGCKNKKKITDTDDPTKNVVKVDENLVKAKSTLQAIIDDEGSKTIEEKEKILADIKALNLNDPELNDMIKKVETSIANEKQRIKDEEEKERIAALPENVLRRYFESISKAGSETEANAIIQQALQMFSSEKSNVLIIVYKGADGTDYDEPTNIVKYLNYLKDTKKNLNDVEKIHYDANNKIKTLELIKK